MQTQASTIKSEQRALGALLSDKRPLRVPAYQRNFSWTISEINDLWDDLRGIIYESHDDYFLGSMVFIHKSDNSLEVVDGQQRLATVSLLLAAIRDGFKGVNDGPRSDHVEIQYLCSRDLKTMEASPKLSLNEMDNEIFTKIIEGGLSIEDIKDLSKDKTIFESNRLIAKTYITLYESVRKGSSDFSDLDYMSNLVEAITENVSCIQIITNTEDSAYVLFETLNDRGLELTLSDMLKNFLFSKAGRRIEEAKHKWTETTTLVGQRHLKTFIRHEWMSRFGQIREKQLYKKIKEQIRSNPKTIEYLDDLRDAAKVYDAIRNPEHDIWAEYGTKCRKLLEEVLLLGTVQCYPLIMSTYFVKPRDMVSVLEWIVCLTVRYSIICAKGTGNLETTYARASSHMRQPDAKSREVKEIIMNIWPSDDEFKISFSEKTLTTPRIIKYMLAKIETHLSEDNSLIPNPESLTVEHILPKKPDKEWPQQFREDTFLTETCNRIGNLTILTDPMNRGAQSKGFANKKKIYAKSNYKITQQLLDYSEWNEETIFSRQKSLSDLAAKIWVI